MQTIPFKLRASKLSLGTRKKKRIAEDGEALAVGESMVA